MVFFLKIFSVSRRSVFISVRKSTVQHGLYCFQPLGAQCLSRQSELLLSTLGHTASLTFQNLISPLNYTGLTWWNGEERETELEQQLEELKTFQFFLFLT